MSIRSLRCPYPLSAGNKKAPEGALFEFGLFKSLLVEPRRGLGTLNLFENQFLP